MRVLEDAGLLATRKVGREKLHYLDPVPIQLIHDRWIGKYAAPRVSALADLKAVLEGATMTTSQVLARPKQVYEVEGQVLESDQPGRLVHTWRALWDADVSKDAPSRGTWELTGMTGGMTKLTVIHDDFEGETATFKRVSGGWTWVLNNLKTFLETGETLPPPAGH